MGGLGAHRSAADNDSETQIATARVNLNLLGAARLNATLLGVIPAGAHVNATNQVKGDYRQVVYEGKTGWVNKADLTS